MANKFTIPPTKSLDDIFRAAEHAASNGDIKQIPLTQLSAFGEHPFKVRDDTDMAELAESVRELGILSALLVRPLPGAAEDSYQIIAGHRRKRAAELAGLAEVPCVVKELDDDEAIAQMVDTNLSRTKILPSEKAWAYKLKLDAMKRSAGRKKNASQFETHSRSDSELAEQSGESRAQIQRLIRLTELIPELLERVDLEQIPVNAGVSLSYVLPDSQLLIEIVLEEFEQSCISNVGVTIKQAEKLRSESAALGEALDEERVRELLAGAPRKLASESVPAKISLETKRVLSYFPAETKHTEIESVVFRLLDLWQRGKVELEEDDRVAADE